MKAKTIIDLGIALCCLALVAALAGCTTGQKQSLKTREVAPDGTVYEDEFVQESRAGIMGDAEPLQAFRWEFEKGIWSDQAGSLSSKEQAVFASQLATQFFTAVGAGLGVAKSFVDSGGLTAFLESLTAPGVNPLEVLQLE